MSTFVKDDKTHGIRPFYRRVDALAWIAKSPDTRREHKPTKAMRYGYVGEKYDKITEIPR